MITLIYPYRNRSLKRIKKSLDSLKNQKNKAFEVCFIDYGSDLSTASKVKKLVEAYSFCNYLYTYSIHQPWNKSRALNIVIKTLKTEYCFVADVDMMYHSSFISKLHEVKHQNKVTYFQVGFLSKEESEKDISFESYTPKFLSTHEATGLSLFPVAKLKELNGFDEFFHFWGAEDTDMHNRLKNYGVSVAFYDNEVLLLHQWHESYLSNRKKRLGKTLVLNGIENHNHFYKDKNKALKVTKVNPKSWGNVIHQDDYNSLNNTPVHIKVSNKKKDLRYLLSAMKTSKTDEVISAEVQKDSFNVLQKIANILFESSYSMELINNRILMTLIEDYRNKNYIYKVSESADKITLKIKL